MAKVYFRYSAMNAGKTTNLLQVAYNYKERGMRALLLKPSVDNREGEQPIMRSRIGLEAECRLVSSDCNLFEALLTELGKRPVHCVLVDEAQFLTADQVDELCTVADNLDIPVICGGLRTDSNGDLFPGSQALLTWADKLEEIKTICHCGAKASRVLRISDDGAVIRNAEQVCIGGNDRYVSVCRKHFKTGIYK